MQLSVVDFMVGLDNAVIFQETDCLKCHGLGFEPIAGLKPLNDNYNLNKPVDTN